MMAGDKASIVEFGNKISLEVNKEVRKLYFGIKEGIEKNYLNNFSRQSKKLLRVRVKINHSVYLAEVEIKQ